MSYISCLQSDSLRAHKERGIVECCRTCVHFRPSSSVNYGYPQRGKCIITPMMIGTREDAVSVFETDHCKKYLKKR